MTQLRPRPQRSGPIAARRGEGKSKIEIVPLVPHADWVNSVAFSPDGKRMLSGGKDGKIKLWEVASGRLIRTLRGHTQDVNAVAFSPDGAYVLSGGGGDASVKLWDIATGQFIRFFIGHTRAVASVAFSPDGKRIASGSFDHTVRLWDVATGKLVREFKGHSGPVASVRVLAGWRTPAFRQSDGRRPQRRCQRQALGSQYRQDRARHLPTTETFTRLRFPTTAPWRSPAARTRQ